MKQKIVIAFAFLMLLAACRSTKDAAGEAVVVQPKCITSKVNVRITTPKDKIVLSGKLQMRRNDVIRLQLIAMGLMEVARLELTPDSFLVMDRINKQYAESPYNDVKVIRNSGHNFNTLQAMFWKAVEGTDKTVSYTTDDKKVKLDITLVAPEENCEWESRTTPSSRYTKVVVDDLLKGITRL